MAGKIHIGTSGWSYRDWKGDFYPAVLKNDEWLSFYATWFETAEIDNSFYRLPTLKTVENWAEEVPAHFRFCPKMSRYLTHMKKLLEPEEPLHRFFEIFDPIKKHLGPILIQLPPNLKFDSDRTTHLFDLLKSKYADHDFVLEVRHDTWLEKEPIALLKKYYIGLVISQSGVGFPYSETITSETIYVRLHGPGKLYGSPYTDEMLKKFARKFKKWRSEGHQVWAFFNNDQHAYAIQNAMRSMELCADK